MPDIMTLYIKKEVTRLKPMLHLKPFYSFLQLSYSWGFENS